LSRARESKIARKNPKMLKNKKARDEEKKHGRIQDKKHTKITVNKMNRNPRGQKEDPPFLDDPQSKNSYLHLLISKPRYRREKGKG